MCVLIFALQVPQIKAKCFLLSAFKIANHAKSPLLGPKQKMGCGGNKVDKYGNMRINLKQNGVFFRLGALQQ